MDLHTRQDNRLEQRLFFTQQVNLNFLVLNSTSKDLHYMLLEEADRNPYLRTSYPKNDRFFYPQEVSLEEEYGVASDGQEISFFYELKDSILWTDWSTEKKWIAEVLASSVQKTGEISVPLNDIANYCQRPLPLVLEVFQEIQELFPFIYEKGKGFLFYYLERIFDNPEHLIIIQNYLELLKEVEGSLNDEKNLRLLTKSVQDCSTILDSQAKQELVNFLWLKLQKLMPILLQFQTQDSSPLDIIRPDITITVDHHKLTVDAQIYDDYFPEITLNTEIATSTVQERKLKKQAQSYIEAVTKRRVTLNNLVQYIIKKQWKFFFQGMKSLLPLTMKSVAQAMNVHPSTVTRMVQHKQVYLEGKIIPLKFFFAKPVAGAKTNFTLEYVLNLIDNIHVAEKKYGKITDRKVQDILHNRGIDIPRRTVNKYRHLLKR